VELVLFTFPRLCFEKKRVRERDLWGGKCGVVVFWFVV
jgi:hypothetical protein